MSSTSETVASAKSSPGGIKQVAFASSPLPKDQSNEQHSNENVPQLPASDPDKDIPTVRLGETIKFDEFGPIIINLDGTTKRIDNWKQLSEREKEVTWRRISKRNEERRRVLNEQIEKSQEAQAADEE